MAGHDPDTAAIFEASEEKCLQKATRKAQEKLNQVFNVTLNIAVTGESGAGKSTFINTLRGISDDDDEGAAETGVTETTTEVTPYKHPTMPNVILWDLPGIGTSKFPAKKYLKQINLDRFDFFIIISSTRFTENDILLAKAIQKEKKSFYFVRSKIDQDIKNEETRKDFNRENTLTKIRNYCIEKLKDFKDHKVFLLNGRDIHSFKFEALITTLINELSEHKQNALLQSVPVSSVKILKQKVRMFERLAWAAALTSGGVAIVPLPGLSFACDSTILLTFFTKCYYSFGLDDNSLAKLAERVNKPHLKSLIKSDLVMNLASNSTIKLSGSALMEYLCSLVPVVGSIAAARISFVMTYKLLNEGLKDLEETALTVLREAGLE